jgi:hypothetical protein
MKEIKFMLHLDQKGKGFTQTELYKDIHKRLINKQIAINVVWGSGLRTPLNSNEVIHMEIPFKAKNDVAPDNLNISNIKKALEGLLDDYEEYSNLRIEIIE